MRVTRSALVALAAGAVVLASGGPALSAVDSSDHGHGLPDRDVRKGKLKPTADQRSDARAIGARVAWNQFGTPSSMVDPGGALATGVQGDSPVAAARAWLSDNRQLFKLSSTENLDLVSAAPLSDGAGHAVTLRQRVGGLKASGGGLVTIGVKRANGWSVISAAGTINGDETLAAKPSLGAEQAVQKAAANAGEQRSLAQIVPMKKRSAGFKTFRFAGVDDAQRAKAVAFPTLDGYVPAFETIVTDTEGAEPSAYRMFVDARSGAILLRESLVHQAAGELEQAQAAPVTQTFNGTLPAEDGGCGPRHGPYTVAAGSNVRAIDVFANADHPLQDIVLHLDRGTTRVASADTLFTPEQIRYAPQGGVPAGDYFVVVCEFDDNAPPVEPRTYSGRITLDDTPAPSPFTARWRVFPGVPLHNQLDMDPWNNPSTDVREDWCWRATANPADCDEVVGNLASRAPWDHNVKANAPTFTTIGNNARTAESWTNSLLPSPTQFRPTSPQRDYTYPFTNSWYEEDCDPGTPYGANFVPGQSYDISAAVTNLFVQHNRMHDWSYYLGFTEENWNAQDSNFGATEAFRENDALVGDAQAGALGAPPGVGTARNNANMITQPEGVSSITNMYLWQPQAGAFYPPCVDGDYDAGVIGHEYGHMIENRMIGKGANRSGHHAGAMGESVSDLMAIEQLNEHGNHPRDANRWATGTYATGNKERGIRNYAGNWPRVGAFPAPSSDPEIGPLNLSDLGYDVIGSTGPHPNGELWTATNFDLRNALAAKYNGQYPESDAALQEQCAKGQVAVDRCPGNRRWIQLMFDSFLLMAPAPSMVDARNAILAADQMRFGGANQNELWLAFARRGFGRSAASSNTTGRPAGNENESDPLPDFEAPGQNNATMRFVARSTEGGRIDATVFVGHYEARVSPVADTDPATNAPATAPTNNLDDRADFAPGTYEFIVTARGYGALRFREEIRPGQFGTLRLDLAPNVASRSQGATASGDSAPVMAGTRTVLSAAAVRENLIDDTEETHWQATANTTPNGHSVDGRQVTVDLAGNAPHRINRVQVSAMLGPVFDAGPPASEITQSRFTALRQFELWACNARQSNCATNAGFSRIYASAADAFPADTPRPVSPALLLREFTFARDPATHLRLVAKHSQCTGAPEYQGEQDADPHNETDCNEAGPDTDPNGPAATRFVRAAELQAFEGASGVR